MTDSGKWQSKAKAKAKETVTNQKKKKKKQKQHVTPPRHEGSGVLRVRQPRLDHASSEVPHPTHRGLPEVAAAGSARRPTEPFSPTFRGLDSYLDSESTPRREDPGVLRVRQPRLDQLSHEVPHPTHRGLPEVAAAGRTRRPTEPFSPTFRGLDSYLESESTPCREDQGVLRVRQPRLDQPSSEVPHPTHRGLPEVAAAGRARRPTEPFSPTFRGLDSYLDSESTPQRVRDHFNDMPAPTRSLFDPIGRSLRHNGHHTSVPETPDGDLHTLNDSPSQNTHTDPLIHPPLQTPDAHESNVTAPPANPNDGDRRMFITAVGTNSFDPISCIRRIMPECVSSYWTPGWTTIRTCPKDARARWFKVFEKLYNWLPEQNDQIRANFNRKCAKLLSDAWHKRRVRKTKGPRWANPDAIEDAAKAEAADQNLPERQARGKQNYKGDVSKRGPSKHCGGPKPTHYHRKLLENTLHRVPTPADYYRKLKVMKSGEFCEKDGQTILDRLEESQREVLQRHPDADTPPEDELLEAAARILGESARTGCPRVIGLAASVAKSTRFAINPSQPTVYSHHPTNQDPAVLEDVVRRIVGEEVTEIRNNMSKMASAMSAMAKAVRSSYHKGSSSKRPRSNDNEDDEEDEDEDEEEDDDDSEGRDDEYDDDIGLDG